MGLYEKLLGRAASAVNITLADKAREEGRVFYDATCNVCNGSFQWLNTPVCYPIPIRVERKKPELSSLDIGGWCVKCNRMLCPREAEYIPFTFKTGDWWVAGCRDCQLPLGGKRNYDDFLARQGGS